MISKVLLSWTTKDIHGIIMKWGVLLSAKPTPLKSAAIASHVIATWYFLNPSFAFRTIANVSVIRSPTIKILVHYWFTFGFSMPLQSTLEADFITTYTYSFVWFSLFHEMSAVRSWTPSEVRIFIYINILLESKVLVVDILRAKFLYVFSIILFVAGCICAPYFDHLTVTNAVFKVVRDAI